MLTSYPSFTAAISFALRGPEELAMLALGWMQAADQSLQVLTKRVPPPKNPQSASRDVDNLSPEAQIPLITYRQSGVVKTGNLSVTEFPTMVKAFQGRVFAASSLNIIEMVKTVQLDIADLDDRSSTPTFGDPLPFRMLFKAHYQPSTFDKHGKDGVVPLLQHNHSCFQEATASHVGLATQGAKSILSLGDVFNGSFASQHAIDTATSSLLETPAFRKMLAFLLLMCVEMTLRMVLVLLFIQDFFKFVIFTASDLLSEPQDSFDSAKSSDQAHASLPGPTNGAMPSEGRYDPLPFLSISQRQLPIASNAWHKHMAISPDRFVASQMRQIHWEFVPVLVIGINSRFWTSLFEISDLWHLRMQSSAQTGLKTIRQSRMFAIFDQPDQKRWTIVDHFLSLFDAWRKAHIGLAINFGRISVESAALVWILVIIARVHLQKGNHFCISAQHTNTRSIGEFHKFAYNAATTCGLSKDYSGCKMRLGTQDGSRGLRLAAASAILVKKESQAPRLCQVSTLIWILKFWLTLNALGVKFEKIFSFLSQELAPPFFFALLAHCPALLPASYPALLLAIYPYTHIPSFFACLIPSLFVCLIPSLLACCIPVYLYTLLFCLLILSASILSSHHFCHSLSLVGVVGPLLMRFLVKHSYFSLFPSFPFSFLFSARCLPDDSESCLPKLLSSLLIRTPLDFANQILTVLTRLRLNFADRLTALLLTR